MKINFAYRSSIQSHFIISVDIVYNGTFYNNIYNNIQNVFHKENYETI